MGLDAGSDQRALTIASLRWLRSSVLQALVDNRLHLLVNFVAKLALFGTQAALLCAQFALLATEFSLLRANFALPRANFTLDGADPRLHFRQTGLQRINSGVRYLLIDLRLECG